MQLLISPESVDLLKSVHEKVRKNEMEGRKERRKDRRIFPRSVAGLVLVWRK